MLPFENKEEAHDWCLAEGNIIPQKEINIDKVKSNLKIAEEYLESAKDSALKKRWNTAYQLGYDVLHLLVESLICFDRIKSRNHQCLFTYLCIKHPELELDWGFFEKIRTKRNGINYYGTPVSQKDWKEIELQLNLYINLLRKTIESKITD